MKKYFDITSWLLLFLFAPFTILILLSQNSIPGGVFYPVKRGLENIILVAASVSPTTRVAFRTDLTGRRFSEAQQLLVTRAETAAFSDFIVEVNSTQQDLSKLSNPQDKIKNADKLIAAIDQYQIQLSQAQNQILVAQGTPQLIQPTASSVPSPSPNQGASQKFCIQVITYAKNPQSGVCQSFATPCDVPDGWQNCSLPGSPGPTRVPAPSQGSPAPSSTPTPAITTAQPFQVPSPAPSLAPTVSNEIATNMAKREEVKNTISNTKEELQKIKEKLQKDREDEQTKEKIDEEQQKLKQNIEESKKSGQNQ